VKKLTGLLLTGVLLGVAEAGPVELVRFPPAPVKALVALFAALLTPFAALVMPFAASCTPAAAQVWDEGRTHAKRSVRHNNHRASRKKAGGRGVPWTYLNSPGLNIL
jgi:hypothetical protein